MLNKRRKKGFILTDGLLQPHDSLPADPSVSLPLILKFKGEETFDKLLGIFERLESSDKINRLNKATHEFIILERGVITKANYADRDNFVKYLDEKIDRFIKDYDKNKFSRYLGGKKKYRNTSQLLFNPY